ncbi:acyltransferase family protein [Clostridium chromiireducens]|uniref:Glucans biosynthesis protein n=1 Tax=Clostridium chromiireducens TaxID=225345 RepID=A0A1V4IGQ0_9CLOT|nr:acyltransferase [Clostridium chromiireducens]OPJ58717.1 glucans biosynthesis protein [Clostridium chromiireducens]
MDKVKKWVPELQSLSGLSIIFVVLIHATSYYLLSVLHMDSFEKVDYSTRLVDNLIHGAVPMFIFIAGYKYALNDSNKPYKEFIKRRVNKVIKPFLVISITFFIKDIITNAEHINIINLCKSFLRIFIGYNAAYQLWYIPLYIVILLVYPILYKMIKDERIRSLFILGIVITQYSLSWFIDLLASHPFDFVYYLLYFHMGLIFCKYDVKNKFMKFDTIIIAAYIVITLAITFNTIDYVAGPLKKFILWPLSVMAYYFFVIRIKENKILQYLGKYSFYIFLLHEPIFCTDISYFFKSVGIYYSVFESFIVGIFTLIVTMILYKVIESTFIKKLIF